MKRLLVFVFALIIGTGFSQADGEMKYLNRNKIEYNGDKINLKKAMELSKGVSEDANTYFRNAKRCNISNGGYLLSNTLALGALVIFASKNKVGLSALRGLFDGFKGIAYFWSIRRSIQSQRTVPWWCFLKIINFKPFSPIFREFDVSTKIGNV